MNAKSVVAAAAIALLVACNAPQQQAAQSPASTKAAEDHAAHDHSGPVTISATPSAPFKAGQPVTLTLRLQDQNGRPIVAEDLALRHEHALHVMIVDAGLEDYAHAHPTANPDGSFSLTFTPRLDRPYRLWTDFSLKGDHGTGEKDDHGHVQGAGDQAHGEDHHEDSVSYASVDLPVGAGAVPSIAAGQVLSARAGGLRFQLSLPSALKSGEATRAQLAVIGEDGMPFSQLEPVMGAYAHIVGFNDGAATMLHVHPDGAAPASAAARGGPVIAFTLEPETVGPHRLFVQVKANGAEIIAPLTVVVAP